MNIPDKKNVEITPEKELEKKSSEDLPSKNLVDADEASHIKKDAVDISNIPNHEIDPDDLVHGKD